ncbi:bifunctional diaminohydroxyphosphoribosylaminopyrimidine deaminase/5-amino-6-(5-phosphoribosylamino)uracil reductase RibD [Thermotalea metallivorans]|nr:bifunctional diaminohydroxyphosphoribosylaminopyrimidine deaminase/5-amino-6-(5-phosphoribosylamino)uracil reductase RibD [Thermotalea metallivorans]
MEKQYMERALELALQGAGYTSPNPLVGAVIVKNGRIIGEGYHEMYGGPHAEINAFLHATEDVKGATMYVTLEPCSHYGKTPPCARAIVDKGISKVVVAMIDPNPLVAGKGIEILKSNGIEVVTGLLEDKAKKLNEIFIKYITTGLPFCILKTAMTLDGKIAAYTGDSKWITNEYSREYVHELRHRVSGIMVGIGTVLADDPSLTTRRGDRQGKDPVRIIVDSRARIPLDAKVLHVSSKARTILATTSLADGNKLSTLEKMGVEVIMTPCQDNQVDLPYLMKALGERKIDSVLLEGGSTLNYAALEAGIVDKIVAFIAPKILGGDRAKTPVGGKGKASVADSLLLRDIAICRFQDDIMIEAYFDA